MKRFTKWLSGMMAVIMLLGLLPTAAFAVVHREKVLTKSNIHSK